MTDATHAYGDKVVEFFKHDDTELQQLLDQRVARYNSNSEGLGYKGLAGNVDFVRHKPLEMSMIEMQDEIVQGYRIVKLNVEALFLKAILRKPEKTIKADLRKLEELVRAEYDQSRYERNVVETARQVEITISMQRRKAEAKAAAEQAAVLAAQQASEEAAALADLRRAYAEPAEVA
ncbi:hypothetical protein REH59_08050 [Pseudomonas sp. BO3-4]|uniref:hypothetical protein n=1 Tax=Pseudomonas sp. BO3-4 TaxID=3094916 RepID=UPI002A5A3C36|nr:hypothetical protein [Pseudomonas sp. BO3-4]WPO31587.1 hypothetical protein REH59_08050 [Pseudomonas sp. BO3-4]